MSFLRRHGPFVLVLLAAAAVGRAQSQATAAATRTVVILGASASAGFSDQLMTPQTPEEREHNQTCSLQQALEPLFAADTVKFKNLSNLTMFLQTERVGARQVQRAVAAAPDLVLAVDFLFWYGYSIQGGDRETRLALQQRGLAELAKIERPLLVGDYPEMRDVDPRMLGQHAIPDRDTLRALNDNLRAWAKDRANVRVFPLSTLLQELREKPREVVLDGRRVVLDPADLLQTDRLHTTRLGMAVLVHHLTKAMAAMLPEDAILHAQAEQLPDILRRLDLLDLARAAGTVAPAAGGEGRDREGRAPAAPAPAGGGDATRRTTAPRPPGR